jgi:hypothetical protein
VLGIVAGCLAGLSPWLLLGLVVPAAYLLLVLASTVIARRHGFLAMAWIVVVLPVIHFTWGVGFILGFLKLTRNLAEFTGR